MLNVLICFQQSLIKHVFCQNCILRFLLLKSIFYPKIKKIVLMIFFGSFFAFIFSQGQKLA